MLSVGRKLQFFNREGTIGGHFHSEQHNFNLSTNLQYLYHEYEHINMVEKVHFYGNCDFVFAQIVPMFSAIHVWSILCCYRFEEKSYNIVSNAKSIKDYMTVVLYNKLHSEAPDEHRRLSAEGGFREKTDGQTI